MTIHPSRMVHIALLIVDKVPITVHTEYSNFLDVFSLKSTIELLEYIEINHHPIELINN